MNQSAIKTGAELSAPESQLIVRAIRKVVEERELEKTLDALRESKNVAQKETFTINGRITQGFPRYDER